MAPADGPWRKDRKPTAKTPAERAEQAAEVQRRLKREAAKRREAATAERPARASTRAR
jgi:hypothetical protein